MDWLRTDWRRGDSRDSRETPRTMITSGSWKNHPFTINLKPDCLIVSVGDSSHASVYTYDLTGRLWSAFHEGATYRRGLDGRILAKSRQPGRARDRRWLPPSEAAALEKDARQTILDLFDRFIGEDTKPPMPPLAEVQSICERIRSFDEERSRVDVENYHRIYRAVGIVPPDQYMAVVLQATEGCSFNTCTFCNLFRTSRFRIKPLDEFRQHAEKVRDFLGEGLSLRRSVFVGDANALVIPIAKLLPLLDAARRAFEEQ